MDEFSLADSKTVGTGYVINPVDGSISMITDDLDNESRATISEKGSVTGSGWNVFSSMFTRNPPSPIRKLSSKKNSSRRTATNRDSFDENVNNLYGNVEFYFNNNYNASSKRLQNRVMFRTLSDASKNTPYPLTTSNDNNNENDKIDFLKDDPSDMTKGRRLAMWLMKYKWYNPYAGSYSNDGTGDTNKEDIFTDNDRPDSADVLQNSNYDVANSLGGEEFKDNDHKKLTKKQNMNTSENLSSPTAVNELEGMENIQLETSSRNNFAKQPSLKKAWAYFEHITLPRYVYEDKPKKDAISQMTTSCGGLNQPKLEIAESGERHFVTKLYHPFFTPVNHLSEFGMGIALYFTTSRAITVLLVIAGLVSIPNMLYFSGPEYSNNQNGVFWAFKGSSVCTNYEYVPCVDCDENNFKHTVERFRKVTNDANELLTFALKNHCDGANQRTILTNLATMAVVAIGMFLISYFLMKEEVRFDEDVQTAHDYSIVIVNAPYDAGDPDEWRDFFMTNFDDLHVTCCTIAVHNSMLVKRLVKRRELLNKIRKHVPPGESLENDVLEALSQDAKESRCCRLFNGLPEFYEKLLDLEWEIRELLKPENHVSSVFITFESEESQQEVLKAMQGDLKQVKNGGNQKYFFRKDYDPLIVREAPEPSAVRWKDLDESQCSIINSFILPYFITTGLIISSALLVRYIRSKFPQEPRYSAGIISIGNIFFPIVARALTNLEVHRREGEKQTSLYIKNAAFRWVNTAIVMTLITPFTSTIMPGEEDLIWSIYTIYFIEIIVKSSLDLLDISGNLKRHILAPRAKTQEDMNNHMRGKELDLADQYTTTSKVLFLSLWYSSIYPACLFLGALALFLHNIVDKFSLMRGWAPSPKLGNTVSQINRRFFLPITIVVMAIVSSYMWTGFSFDNLCPVNEIETKYFGEMQVPAFDNSDDFITINVTNETPMYRFCEQSYISLNIFPAIPSLLGSDKSNWMTSEQKQFSEIYGWFSLGVFFVIIVLLAYSIGYSTNTMHKVYTKPQNISFTASGASAYIPEVKSSLLPYPLIACAVTEIENIELFNWVSPYYPHIYYDLTLDAEYIMMDGDNGSDEMANLAFSKVKYWEPPII